MQSLGLGTPARMHTVLLGPGDLVTRQSGSAGLAELLRLQLQPGDSEGMQDAGP